MTQHIDADSPIAHEAAQDAREILSGGLLLQVDRILEGPIFKAGQRALVGTDETMLERSEYFVCLLGAMVKIAVAAAASKDRRDGLFGSTLAATITAADLDGWTF